MQTLSFLPFYLFELILQVLRSISDWSGGIGTKNVENSIYEAYLHLIATSKHYIYIGTQQSIPYVKSSNS